MVFDIHCLIKSIFYSSKIHLLRIDDTHLFVPCPRFHFIIVIRVIDGICDDSTLKRETQT
jgi:hypothetical protein